jgi:hypothetical protein
LSLEVANRCPLGEGGVAVWTPFAGCVEEFPFLPPKRDSPLRFPRTVVDANGPMVSRTPSLKLAIAPWRVSHCVGPHRIPPPPNSRKWTPLLPPNGPLRRHIGTGVPAPWPPEPGAALGPASGGSAVGQEPGAGGWRSGPAVRIEPRLGWGASSRNH